MVGNCLRWACLIAAGLAAGGSAPDTIEIRYLAALAVNEGRNARSVDPKLEEARTALESVKEYDTFTCAASGGARLTPGQPSTVSLTPRFAMRIETAGPSKDGRLRVRVQIQDKTPPPGAGGKRSVVDTTCLLASGKFLTVRGIRIDSAELIIMLTPRMTIERTPKGEKNDG